MFKIGEYLMSNKKSSGFPETAREYEEIFRAILRDLKMNRDERPMGCYVPKNLETEASLGIIMAKYTTGEEGYGIFTILDFDVNEGEAMIKFSKIACLSGGGATLIYNIEGKEVKYSRPRFIIRS
jgi:hypothetical protein